MVSECEAKGCTNASCEHMVAKEVTEEVTNNTEIAIEKETVDGKVKAKVTKTVNGTAATETFEGTAEEVDAKIAEFKKK